MNENDTGEPCAVKIASTVRRGTVGKGAYQCHLASCLPYHLDLDKETEEEAYVWKCAA
jgi:hypothetical protein